MQRSALSTMSSFADQRAPISGGLSAADASPAAAALGAARPSAATAASTGGAPSRASAVAAAAARASAAAASAGRSVVRKLRSSNEPRSPDARSESRKRDCIHITHFFTPAAPLQRHSVSHGTGVGKQRESRKRDSVHAATHTS